MKSFFDKSLLRYSLNLVQIKIDLIVLFCSCKLKKCFRWWNQQTIAWIRCWTPPSSGRIWKRLGHRKQIWKSWLTKVKGNCQIGFPLRNFFFLIFLTPQCTFGTKKAQKAHTGTPSKKVLFQKTWRKRVKEYSFNLGTERGIVEDYVAVILPPQLTL